MDNERNAFRFQMGQVPPFNIDALITDQTKKAAVTMKALHMAVNEVQMYKIASDFLAWRESVSSGFGAFFRPRLKSTSALRLCARTSKFIVGLLRMIGCDDHPDVALSLDFLLIPHVVKTVIQVLQDRGLHGSRLYQVCAEAKMMTAFCVERVCIDMTPQEKSQVRMTSIEAHQIVCAAMTQAAIDKKAESRVRAALSTEDREAMHLQLTEAERKFLVEKCEKFFSKPTPATGADKSLAYSFMSHLCTYLLVCVCVRAYVCE